MLEDKSNERTRVYGRMCGVIENSEEGNRKIVDGVIKVGSVAFRRLSLKFPLCPEPQKN